MHGKIIELSREVVKTNERISEVDYYDNGFVGCHADYVIDVTEEERRDAILNFLSFLENRNCILNGDISNFIFSSNIKEKYFLTNFKQFKNLSEAITLKEFSNYNTNVYRLQHLLEDDEFYVHCDGLFYKIDAFIREYAEDNGVWYFGGVIDYHI